jgi:hypothetical protein
MRYRARAFTQRRAELPWERPNRAADGQSTDDARWRGGTESRCDGKHVGVQEQASACSLRGLVPRPSGTAVYNASGAVAPRKIREACPHGRRNEVKPVRMVVWDPWLALAVSHGDPILKMLSVCISTMSNTYHRYDQLSAVDIIDDSIITNTNSVCML